MRVIDERPQCLLGRLLADLSPVAWFLPVTSIVAQYEGLAGRVADRPASETTESMRGATH
jgi:hypothetical protein